MYSAAGRSDTEMHRYPGPADTVLCTDRDGSDCQSMALKSVTIAPARASSNSPNDQLLYSLRPIPTDWFDYTASVGSMRKHLMQGGLNGIQNWIDYDAPVGSIRNSAGT